MYFNEIHTILMRNATTVLYLQQNKTVLHIFFKFLWREQTDTGTHKQTHTQTHIQFAFVCEYIQTVCVVYVCVCECICVQIIRKGCKSVCVCICCPAIIISGLARLRWWVLFVVGDHVNQFYRCEAPPFQNNCRGKA